MGGAGNLLAFPVGTTRSAANLSFGFFPRILMVLFSCLSFGFGGALNWAGCIMGPTTPQSAALARFQWISSSSSSTSGPPWIGMDLFRAPAKLACVWVSPESSAVGSSIGAKGSFIEAVARVVLATEKVSSTVVRVPSADPAARDSSSSSAISGSPRAIPRVFWYALRLWWLASSNGGGPILESWPDVTDTPEVTDNTSMIDGCCVGSFVKYPGPGSTLFLFFFVFGF
mmetsp:Transcript_18194/g.24594  ORF Transcript_18194/g.24594 Transcript_18194/m.24594 type:complete len:228 (+) Transcript_18194:611-1294(+)